MITKERFIELFKITNSELHKIDGDNCYLGLQLLSKYTKNLICGAAHDQVFSENLDNLIEAGITEEDVIQLRKLNWSIEDGDYLYCFV